MTTLIATDLDRTLIFSEGFSSRHPTSTPVCEVETYQGRNISVAAREVIETLRWLDSRVTLVPTTTRTQAQLGRVRLGFTPRFEICCSGAVLLDANLPDPRWTREVRTLIDAECMTYDEAVNAFASWTGKGWQRELRDADGIFLIASVDAALLPADELLAVTETCVMGNWRVVHQGSKVYALPRVVTKSAAVAHLRERLGEEVWAAGDSVLDWDMLAHATRAWTPADGELAASGRTAGHLRTTAAVGLDASVEIVRAWRELTEAAAPADASPPPR